MKSTEHSLELSNPRRREMLLQATVATGGRALGAASIPFAVSLLPSERARAQGADIFFWDESGFRADTVHGKTWVLRGQTPVVQRPGQRQSMSAASAVNATGAFWYSTYDGKLALHFLPGYAPDLNPDELVWSHVKRTGPARRPLLKGEKLREKIEEQLAKLQQMPHLVRSFFKAPSVAYVGDC